jgi:putative PIN family toxin of toxin-antitoxin system
MPFGGNAGRRRSQVNERIRVLADTNVLVAAVTSREGVSARLLIAARAGLFQLVVSPLLLDELETVLARPKFRRYLSADDARRFVTLVREFADVVDDPPASDEQLTPDPDDDFLVVLAEAADVDVLVSGDRHLLGMNRAGLMVKSPGEFLADVVDG